jgi:hypothetical protein
VVLRVVPGHLLSFTSSLQQRSRHY